MVLNIKFNEYFQSDQDCNKLCLQAAFSCVLDLPQLSGDQFLEHFPLSVCEQDLPAHKEELEGALQSSVSNAMLFSN